VKLLLCVHGYPPELVGGTELSTQRLAHGLARRGHEVLVLAGSVEGSVPGELTMREQLEELEGAAFPVRVLRLTRPDLYYDHWHKSKSARVARAVRELLERERPELVHVQHWLRLTRDLVQLAGQAGVPAVCSLHDSWVSCPLVLRIETAERTACERPLGAPHCLTCAGRVPPRTPWVSLDAGFLALAQRGQDVAAELATARALIVPTRGFGDRQRAFLGDAASELEFQVLPPAAPPTYAAQHEPLAPPAELGCLRLGAWGVLSDAKGTDLLLEALEGTGVELVLAGGEVREGYVDGLRARYPGVRLSHEGAYDVDLLDRHPVGRVHAMVSASRAPESFGLVLDEARALGLPAVLPDQGAFAERGGESRGSLLFEPGSAGALRDAVLRLRDEPGLLASLERGLPSPVTEEDVVQGHLAVYERVLATGPPAEVPCPEWYAERMVDFEEEAWDRRLGEHDARELGLDAGPQA
jgi:glycosyltransferase involved in cell wall biosynthesis